MPVICIAAALPFVFLAIDGVNSAVPSALAAAASLVFAVVALASLDAPLAAPRHLLVASLALVATLGVGMGRALWSDADIAVPAAALQCAKILGYAALTIAGLVIASSRRRAERLATALVIAGGGYVALALALGRPLLVENVPEILNGRFGGTLLNANAAATVFAMIAVLALARLLALLRRPEIYLFRPGDVAMMLAVALALLLAVVALLLTQSRMALAGLAIVSIATIGRDLRAHGLGPAGRIVIAVAAVVGVGAVLLAGDALIARLPLLAADTFDRMACYRHLAGIVAQAPLWGHGLGSFIDVNTANMTADRVTTMWNWGAAHHLPLDALIEGGLAFAVPIAVCFGAIATGMLHRGPARMTADAFAAAMAVVVALLSASVDIALNVPGVAAFASLLLGVAWSDRLMTGYRLAIGYSGPAT